MSDHMALSSIFGLRLPPDAEAPRPMHEAQIMELQARHAHYQRCMSLETFPFRVGDLVTPRPGSSLYHAGEPHIVMEIAPLAEPLFADPTSSSGSPDFGMRPQVRAMSLSRGGLYLCYWVEGHQLEPYSAPGESA